VAGQHVEEEVEGGAAEGRLGEDAGGALELGGDGVEAHQPGHVLRQHREEQRVLGGQQVGALGPVEEVPDGDLRQRQHGEEVDGEEAAEVASRDGGRVDHQLAAPEHSRRRRDVGRPELQRDAGEVEGVHGGAHHGGHRGQVAVEADAGVLVRVLDGEQVEEERVDGDGDDAGEDEGAVHARQERVLRVEHLLGHLPEVLLEHQPDALEPLRPVHHARRHAHRPRTELGRRRGRVAGEVAVHVEPAAVAVTVVVHCGPRGEARRRCLLLLREPHELLLAPVDELCPVAAAEHPPAPALRDIIVHHHPRIDPHLGRSMINAVAGDARVDRCCTGSINLAETVAISLAWEGGGESRERK
jgi:hypothetical protein